MNLLHLFLHSSLLHTDMCWEVCQIWKKIKIIRSLLISVRNQEIWSQFWWCVVCRVVCMSDTDKFVLSSNTNNEHVFGCSATGGYSPSAPGYSPSPNQYTPTYSKDDSNSAWGIVQLFYFWGSVFCLCQDPRCFRVGLSSRSSMDSLYTEVIVQVKLGAVAM